eukprot:TRINITY_DN3394_c0_g1_i1.p1 TRINITY_DN3394_c0_g1~~TRINITY_DN3394_c0_g1_i1.p1  ORF type:complete len:600 (-),score=107.60 TRINITY_DN3394_c0_g1_i1:89-1888(-)
MAEYEVNGISDPFLQIYILNFFNLLGTNDKEISNEISDILANVATNTSLNKNTGVSICSECVNTIMSIESTPTLRILAISVLGKFLSNKDSNSKYISLFSLQKFVQKELATVQKHKAMILECLKENDNSIKLLALDLIFAITNETNIIQIAEELLAILQNKSDPEFLQELTLKFCLLIDKYAPDRTWQIDIMIQVLNLAGNYMKEENISTLINMIAITKELHSYSLIKIYQVLNDHPDYQGVQLVGFWCLGELGEQLLNSEEPILESSILNLIEKILLSQFCSQISIEYGLTALLKLWKKFPLHQTKIQELIQTFQNNPSIEVQQRVIEYEEILNEEWRKNRDGILEKMPVFEVGGEKGCGIDMNFQEKQEEEKGKGKVESPPLIDFLDSMLDSSADQQKSNQQTNQGNLLDLMSLDENPKQQQQSTSPVKQQDQGNILDLYENKEQQQKQQQAKIQQQQIQKPKIEDIKDLIFEEKAQDQQVLEFTGFEDSNLKIHFYCYKQNNNQTKTLINLTYSNKTEETISDIVVQIAVQKHLKLQMGAIQHNSLTRTLPILKQQLFVENSIGGKKIALKMKISYKINDSNFSCEKLITNFPENY